MSQYDGLNLSELISLMHDLAMPEPVPWIPATPGWWILFSWLIGTVLVATAAVVKRRRLNRYRREALAELTAIENESESSPGETAQRIAVLLKRTALVAYPRDQVASLFGADWARFLKDSTNNDRHIVAAADKLAVAAYQSDCDSKMLCKPARRWIRLHRA